MTGKIIYNDVITGADYIELLAERSGAYVDPDDLNRVTFENFDDLKAAAGYPDLFDYPLTEADYFINEVGGAACIVSIENEAANIFELYYRICELPWEV